MRPNGKHAATVRILRTGLRQAVATLKASQDHGVTHEDCRTFTADAIAILEATLKDARNGRSVQA